MLGTFFSIILLLITLVHPCLFYVVLWLFFLLFFLLFLFCINTQEGYRIIDTEEAKSKIMIMIITLIRNDTDNPNKDYD